MGMRSSTRPVPEHFCPEPIAQVVAKQKAKQTPESIGSDEFPIYADDPLHDSHVRLDHYLRAAGTIRPWDTKVSTLPAGKAILDTPKSDWPKHLRAIVQRLLFHWTHCVKDAKPLGGMRMWSYDFGEQTAALKPLAAALMNKIGADLSDQDYVLLMDQRSGNDKSVEDLAEAFTADVMIYAAEKIVAARGLSQEVGEVVTALRDKLKESAPYAGRNAQNRVHRLDEILGQTPAERMAILDRGEPWAEAVMDFLESSKKEGANWTPLLEHCKQSDASKPSGKWLKEAKKWIDAIGGEAFISHATEWLALAAKPRLRPLTDDEVAYRWRVGFDIYSEKNGAVLKGLAWACGAANDPNLARALGTLAEWCYTKIPDHGPRSPVVGNACLISLIGLPGQEPRAELSRLKAKVKQPTARKMIEKAIGASAAAAGMTTDDLEEQAVGTYGLTEIGRGERKIGGYTVETLITGTTKVELRFIDVKGKSRASVPADVKDDPAVKEVQRQAKDLTKMLPALRDRIERMPMNRRELPLCAWRERYLDHPVVATIARRLIWEIAPDPTKPQATLAAAWRNEKLVDAADQPIAKLKDDAIVRLWHARGASAKDVLRWREFVQRHQITQPFKQAHREVYLITDAERRTSTYSNRFAEHILRQHQFAALCTQRGWRYRIIGTWDDGGDHTPTLELPKWNLTAQFWIDVQGDAAAHVAGSGAAMYVTTDQVRFYDNPPNAAKPKRGAIASGKTGGELMKLENVPALAFSEVMRDVDLFVGVTSMGNDPQALPAANPLRAYWHGFAFGELTPPAETRKLVLEKLLPRLKIASRASIVNHFLVVRGELRTYKIHLGSGNILMEPNDQYLCIVPDRVAEVVNLFLPFEGDDTLSIILSKAFLLAEDKKIKDPTILRQIDLTEERS